MQTQTWSLQYIPLCPPSWLVWSMLVRFISRHFLLLGQPGVANNVLSSSHIPMHTYAITNPYRDGFHDSYIFWHPYLHKCWYKSIFLRNNHPITSHIYPWISITQASPHCHLVFLHTSTCFSPHFVCGNEPSKPGALDSLDSTLSRAFALPASMQIANSTGALGQPAGYHWVRSY